MMLEIRGMVVWESDRWELIGKGYKRILGIYGNVFNLIWDMIKCMYKFVNIDLNKERGWIRFVIE